jgi:hypothetical protein
MRDDLTAVGIDLTPFGMDPIEPKLGGVTCRDPNVDHARYERCRRRAPAPHQPPRR